VLVNAVRAEAVQLLDMSGGGGGSLVLPGPSFQTRERALRAEQLGRPIDGIDAAWLAGARLLVLGWELETAYPLDERLRVSAAEVAAMR
jgi:hypothetical protein